MTKSGILILAMIAGFINANAQSGNVPVSGNTLNVQTAVAVMGLDEIIAGYIKALGGKENLEKIKNVVMEGSLTVGGAEIQVTITQVDKKLMRQDISAMGMIGYDFLTDKEGWTFMPFQGMQKPEPKTADEVKESQSDLDIAGPLFNYEAKGNKAELLGTEDVEGTTCNKIKVVLASGKEQTYFIDVKSNLIVRLQEKRKFNGKEVELKSDFSDYKEVEGVKMPFSVSQAFGTVLFSSVKLNQTIDDKLYKHD